MKILAIDSSSAPASIAITENDALVGEFTINIGKTHSEKLLPLVDQLLDAVDLSMEDIDAFAISQGPGSFTGLRIGMSAAKLMAQVAGKPLIAVGTLEALAMNVLPFDGFICPMLDARNNTVFTALYICKDGKLTELLPPQALLTSELNSKLTALCGNIMLCGEYEKYAAKFDENTVSGHKICRAPRILTLQRASSCAVVAYTKLLAGENTHPNDVVPLYVRDSQAEQAKKSAKAKRK